MHKRDEETCHWCGRPVDDDAPHKVRALPDGRVISEHVCCAAYAVSLQQYNDLLGAALGVAQ